MAHPTYFDVIDHHALLRAFPIGTAFLEGRTRLSRDELHTMPAAQVRTCMKRGWEIPFYRRLWSARGIEPGDINLSLIHISEPRAVEEARMPSCG